MDQQKKHKFVEQITKLPTRSMIRPQLDITIIEQKQEKDPKHNYLYKNMNIDINKHSSDEQIEQNIHQLIKLSKQKLLSITQQYMLNNYINIYIREIFAKLSNKNRQITEIKIREQWLIMQNIWRLFKIKYSQCKDIPFHQEQLSCLEDKFEKMKKNLTKTITSKQKIDYNSIHSIFINFIDVLKDSLS